MAAQVGPLLLLFSWATLPTTGQSGSRRADWPTYGGDLASTRYSPLEQITAGNFNTLHVAWRFKTDSPGRKSNHENTKTTKNTKKKNFLLGTGAAVVAQPFRAAARVGRPEGLRYVNMLGPRPEFELILYVTLYRRVTRVQARVVASMLLAGR